MQRRLTSFGSRLNKKTLAILVISIALLSLPLGYLAFGDSSSKVAASPQTSQKAKAEKEAKVKKAKAAAKKEAEKKAADAAVAAQAQAAAAAQAAAKAKPATPAPPPACTYPAQILDLANWKEQLPTGSPGSVTEVKQPQLASFVSNPYFRPNSACNGVVFQAPTDGVTTSGSTYPRSELREMTGGGTSNANWTSAGTHIMYLDQAITAAPNGKRHVVAGQVHNLSSDVIAIRLEYPKLFIDYAGADGPVLNPNYALGTRFNVKIVVVNGALQTFYNGTLIDTRPLNDAGLYFKAGAYTQSNCTTEAQRGAACGPNNYGEVQIYDAWVQHS